MQSTDNGAGNRARSGRSGGNPRKRRKKNNFAVFYIITLVVGIIVCLALFAFGYQAFVGGFDRILSGNESTPHPTPTGAPHGDYQETIAMVLDVDLLSHPRTATLRILESGRDVRFDVPDTAALAHRTGSPMSLGEFSAGQLVDVEYNENIIAAMSISARAFEESGRRITVNLDNGTIAIGNAVFEYSRNTLVLNQGRPHSIGLIGPDDIVTISRYENKIWSIRIDSGHGFVRFLNADLVADGTVTVGTVFASLDGDNISVPEGNHRVIIEGSNIEPLLTDVTVQQAQTAVVDLSAVRFRTSTLQLMLGTEGEPGFENAAAVQNASVFLNGEEAEFSGQFIATTFGTHSLRIERHGFAPIQQDIEITHATQRVEVTMVREILAAQIQVTTFPIGAQIFHDNALIGVSPLTLELEHGTQTILARLPGYEDNSITIQVSETSPREFLLTMRQITAPPAATMPGQIDTWPDLPPHLQQPVLPEPVLPELPNIALPDIPLPNIPQPPPVQEFFPPLDWN